jgi:hypothetical protein
MLPSAAVMSIDSHLYHGLFSWHAGQGDPYLSRQQSPPETIPCPTTGHLLRVATIDAEAMAICPRCSVSARGGFVSFVSDLRMAYACPRCRELVWLAAV